MLIIYFLILYIYNLRRQRRVLQAKLDQLSPAQEHTGLKLKESIINKLIFLLTKIKEKQVVIETLAEEEDHSSKSIDIKYLYKYNTNIKNMYISPDIVKEPLLPLKSELKDIENTLKAEAQLKFSDLLENKQNISENLFSKYTKIRNQYNDNLNIDPEDDYTGEDQNEDYADEIGVNPEYLPDTEEEIQFRRRHVQPSKEELDDLSNE